MLEAGLGYFLATAELAAVGTAITAAVLALLEVILVVVIAIVIIAVICIIVLAIIKFVEWLFTVAIPWVIETVAIVIDHAVDRYEEIKAKIKDLSDVIPVIITTVMQTHIVYRIYMIAPGEYDKRNWGFGWSEKHIFPQDCEGDNTFKYGITMFTVPIRYRLGYIHYELFVTGRLWYKYLSPRIHVLQARVEEKTLLLGYHMKHSTFPPGNSKFG